jgi:hypothetical protein
MTIFHNILVVQYGSIVIDKTFENIFELLFLLIYVTFLTFKQSVNKPLGIVTPLSILVILTINLNCLKLRYSKNPT